MQRPKTTSTVHVRYIQYLSHTALAFHSLYPGSQGIRVFIMTRDQLFCDKLT
jgi:hypothetical protein